MARTPFAPIAVVLAGLLLAPGAVSTASAQSADAESVKALKELVAEVRSLRAVIEQYANAQIQSQAVGELLSVQQRRVADATSRLDAVRHELDAIAAGTRTSTGVLTGDDERLRKVTDATERGQIEQEQRATRAELEQLTAQEQVLRSRESEFATVLALEEAKWNELVDRLNQWLRR